MSIVTEEAAPAAFALAAQRARFRAGRGRVLTATVPLLLLLGLWQTASLFLPPYVA